MKVGPIIVSLILSALTTSQTNAATPKFNELETRYSQVLANFRSNAIAEETSDLFRVVLEQLQEDIERELRKGYSFDDRETDQVKKMRDYVEALKNFVGTCGAAKSNVWTNGKSIRLVKELVPEITFGYLKNLGECGSLYEVGYGKYKAVLIKHSTIRSIKRIFYSVRLSKSKMFYGNFGLEDGVYKQIFNNSKNISLRTFDVDVKCLDVQEVLPNLESNKDE